MLKTIAEYFSFDWQKGLRTLSAVFPTSPMETGTLADQYKTPPE